MKSSQQSFEVGIFIIPISKMRKQRHGASKQSFQDYQLIRTKSQPKVLTTALLASILTRTLFRILILLFFPPLNSDRSDRWAPADTSIRSGKKLKNPLARPHPCQLDCGWPLRQMWFKGRILTLVYQFSNFCCSQVISYSQIQPYLHAALAL